MKLRKFRLFLPVAAILALAACATPPPLNDHITVVPVSDKADIESGLTINYFYGSHENTIIQVACHADGSCLYGGHAYSADNNNPQLDSLVIRTRNESILDWARTYQIEDVINNNTGLIATGDGGALLYGNSLLTNGLGIVLKPVYEKIDESGNPEWGGEQDKGRAKIFSSFTNGISLSDGGYALTGSSQIDGQWRGTVLRLDSSGKQVWFTSLGNAGQTSLLLYLTELPNKHILGVGVNKNHNDLTLYDLARNGRLVRSWILRMAGSEFPVGVSKTDTGPAILVSVERPNGEQAALLVRLNWKEKLESTTLYRYSDGFDPNNLVVLPDQTLCLFGATTSQDNPQSLAFTIDSGGRPVSAIAEKGGRVFIDGTLVSPQNILFAGGRTIGADKRDSGVIVKWTPSIDNDHGVLSGIKEEPIKSRLEISNDAQQQLTTKSVVTRFGRQDMTSRLVSGGPGSKAVPPTARKASQQR